ncbi:MAG: hypothetical protein PUC38_07860, partial [Bacteroidales bacterium]|nr:hypothetical protein [Bacteroidales bacterium]
MHYQSEFERSFGCAAQNDLEKNSAMIKISYSTRAFVKGNGQVAIRVRWNSKKSEVTFITGVYADPNK